MKILKIKLEGAIDNFNILSSSVEFTGTSDECEEEMARLKSVCEKNYTVVSWSDGFVCENESGRADFGYDIYP